MNWQKLEEKVLEDLKKTGQYILVSHDGYEYPYDIIEFLDLEGLGLAEEEMGMHWNSYLHTMRKYEYEDWEVLDLFTHFCLINNPGGNNENTNM